VILDGYLPCGLVRHLSGHETRTIHARRWSDLDDGALLAACENEHDAFVTMDQSLRFQQNRRGRRLAVVLLHAHSNRLVDLEGLVPELLAVLPNAVSGEVTHVGVKRQLLLTTRPVYREQDDPLCGRFAAEHVSLTGSCMDTLSSL